MSEEDASRLSGAELRAIVGPDYGAADYVRLPDFGQGYYSLTDAALLAALDMWSCGRAPSVPVEGWEGADGVLHDLPEDPEIHKALEPLQAQLLAALVRSAEAGQLEVEVRARNLDDARFIPSRTFVTLQDLVEWLEIYGHERGDIIAEIEEISLGDPWAIASQVAEDRARFRLAQPSPGVSRFRDFDRERLEVELEAKRLHIVYLERQMDELRKGPVDRPVSLRQRRTLLTLIAALARKAGIDTNSRGAAGAIASATQEIGAPVGDDQIRAFLRELPDAVDSRSR